MKLEVQVAMCDECLKEVTYSSSPPRNVICRRKKPSRKKTKRARGPGCQQLTPNGVFPYWTLFCVVIIRPNLKTKSVNILWHTRTYLFTYLIMLMKKEDQIHMPSFCKSFQDATFTIEDQLKKCVVVHCFLKWNLNYVQRTTNRNFGNSTLH